MRKSRVPLKWNWSWGLGLFIVFPALTLALLGMRAVRAERIEQEQKLREQQNQIARLIDEGLKNKLFSLPADLKQQNQNEDQTGGALAGAYDFSWGPNGLLRFNTQRVYFGEQAPPQWPPAVEDLIAQARTASAQGRDSDAALAYHRIFQLEPKLREWADIGLAAIKQDAGETNAMSSLINTQLAGSDVITPEGLPLALMASAYIERIPSPEQTKLASFIDGTLQRLRRGRWWLNYDERAFYDEHLRQTLERISGRRLPEDPQLKQLAAIEQILRVSAPTVEASPYFERTPASAMLISWSKVDLNSSSREGFAISQERLANLLDSILSPLLSGQAFTAEIQDPQGGVVWGNLRGQPVTPQPLRSVRGLEIAFSGSNGSSWLSQKQLMWVAFILVLVAMMIAGLAMTARAVRREVELGQMQNDFIAAVSHEFKSPIASIRLLMERITTGRLRTPESVSEYYAAIDREAQRLERLVNRLLEWQQIQAGHRSYTFGPRSLATVANTAVEQMLPQADAKGIRIHIDIAGALPHVSLDEIALTDAIENLIDNAIKYSPAQTIINLSVRTNNGEVLVEVTDEGIGIDQEELPRIFDKFYRGRRGDLRNVHGTGLGLALVKATAEAHSGGVEVTSKPGVGSCFRLRLPINNGASKDGTNTHS